VSGRDCEHSRWLCDPDGPEPRDRWDFAIADVSAPGATTMRLRPLRAC